MSLLLKYIYTCPNNKIRSLNTILVKNVKNSILMSELSKDCKYFTFQKNQSYEEFEFELF